MSGLLPQEVIDRVREASDIVEVIGSYLPLRKSGANFVGLCPFHTEKTPSFNVNPARQIFHCFGCGEGGNVLSFIMKQEKLQFMDALQLLADRAGISLPRKKGESAEYDLLIEINREAAEFYRRQLAHAPAQVRDYVKRRGLSPDTVERFHLGYAPDSWEACLRHLTAKKFTPEEVENAGLAKRSANGNLIDRFRNRLIFPIFDEKGRGIGFGGRIFGAEDAAQKGPKYLNSPETPIYFKSRVLYGLNFAAAKIRAENRVFIVEGYMDLITLHQAGIENAVASSGTAFTDGQCRILKRFTPNLVMIFDGDEAGRKAAERATAVAAKEMVRPSVAMLPPGKDPDDLVRSGGVAAFMEIVGQAKPYVSYLIDLACRKFGTATAEGRADSVRAMLPEIRKVLDPIERSSYIETLSQKTSIPASVIEGQVKATTPRRPEAVHATSPVEKQVRRPTNIIPASPAEKMILHHILNEPKKFSGFIGDLKDAMRTPQYVTMLNHIGQKMADGVADSGELIEMMEDGDVRAAMRHLFMDEELVSDSPQKMMEDYVRSAREKTERRAMIAKKKLAAEENLRNPE